VFLDEVEVEVTSGRGGDGAVHFRREKYVPRGGPDGGNGGKGGDVVLEARPTLSTLSAFRHRPAQRAADGRPGGPGDRTGHSGDDLVLAVPVGTMVRDVETGDLLGDLAASGDRLVVCRGGRGGRGNARFATPSNQAPRLAEKGEPSRTRRLQLELRLIADVGIIGVPNAGKSTLLSVLTRAHPKIGDYPFTTLEPNLGVLEFDDGGSLVLADIPGLIEGAHAGAGLGDAFLRHIQRTRLLIHLLDGMADDPRLDQAQINAEMALFDDGLAQKPQIVVVNKIDIPEVRQRWPALQRALQANGIHARAISALARRGTQELANEVRRVAQATPPPQAAVTLPVYRRQPTLGDFAVEAEGERTWRVRGEPLERAAAMTYWDLEESVRRFQRLLGRIGVEDALREAGARPGDSVRIAEHEFEWQD